MRVLMVAYSYYETDNRIRRYAETLARRGDQVEVVSLRKKGQQETGILNQVKVFRIQQREINERTKFDYLFRIVLFLFNSFIFITRQHLKEKYDLIHVHSVPDFEVFAALVPKLTGTKVILDIHDIVPEFYASKFNTGKDSLVTKMLEFIERICCQFSDHVIISNHIWGERLIQRSVEEQRCSVILNYPDPVIFNCSREKKKSDKFILMYPGTVSWHQGIDIAVRAMHQVCKKNPNIEFHIYGKGPEEKKVRKLVDTLQLTDNVKFCDLLPIDEIVEKMYDADLGIVPKRDDEFGGEAFSTKILEFMILGVPVLIAETKVDRYYFNESVVTFFKSENANDLAEKILMLEANRRVLQKQSESAHEFINKNNWNVKRYEYLSILQQLFPKMELDVARVS